MKWVSDIESEGGEETALTLDSVARHRKGPAGRVTAVLEAWKEFLIDLLAALELLALDFGQLPRGLYFALGPSTRIFRHTLLRLRLLLLFSSLEVLVELVLGGIGVGGLSSRYVRLDGLLGDLRVSPLALAPDQVDSPVAVVAAVVAQARSRVLLAQLLSSAAVVDDDLVKLGIGELWKGGVRSSALPVQVDALVPRGLGHACLLAPLFQHLLGREIDCDSALALRFPLDGCEAHLKLG